MLIYFITSLIVSYLIDLVMALFYLYPLQFHHAVNFGIAIAITIVCWVIFDHQSPITQPDKD